MENLDRCIEAIEALPYSGNVRCIEALDNLLQDILVVLARQGHGASGELVELKNCSWVLHERYHMDSEAELKFTFHHTKHRLLKSCIGLRERQERRARVSNQSRMVTLE